MQPGGFEQSNLYDVYLPYLPDREEVERLDAFLAVMLAGTQAELDRLTPQARPDALSSP